MKLIILLLGFLGSSRPNLTPRTNTETDWGKMALMWAKEQKQKKRERGEGTPGYQDQ